MASREWIMFCPMCRVPLPDWHTSKDSARQAIKAHLADCILLQTFCEFLSEIGKSSPSGK